MQISFFLNRNQKNDSFKGCYVDPTFVFSLAGEGTKERKETAGRIRREEGMTVFLAFKFLAENEESEKYLSSVF